MALINRGFHSFSTVQEHAPKGWNWCMSKAYCKYPAIIGIVIAIVVSIFTLYCCLRCCCGGRRRRGGKSSQPSRFNPLPYQGYQPANQPHHHEPARFAQFDAQGFTRKGGDDSLPHMPSWQGSQTKHIEDKSGAFHSDAELGRLDHEQKAPMISNDSTVDLSRPSQTAKYNEAYGHEIRPPTEAYTGPDFGAGVGNGTDTSYGGAATAAGPAPHHKPQLSGYTGPDFTSPKAYTAYAPNQPQEMATSGSPTGQGQQHGFQQAPSVLQAGRRS